LNILESHFVGEVFTVGSVKPIAVIDTNVLVDLYSWHDYLRHIEQKIAWVLANPKLDDPITVMRRARAGEALLLAIYLNKIRAVTFSISEAVTMMGVLVPANAKGSAPLNFTKTFIYFVVDELLSGWTQQMQVTDARSNAADDLLLAYAKENSLPLITNEGYSPTGIDHRKRMRKRAMAVGVTLVRAADFYRDEIDERAEADAFLDRFKRKSVDCIRRYVKAHPGGKRAITQIVHDMGNYFYHVLRPDDVTSSPMARAFTAR
jgi:hypothetical protein